MDDFDMDDDFEPQARSRSNTWPVKPREIQAHIEHATPSDQLSNDDNTSPIFEDSAAGSSKRGGSRKNAWGNFSYADLISRAIESTPEKRLTLAQIYDWLVQNVPYFKDKGDCNSSAGWKNSIRHNLSLHSRFIRVQNEGTGKSSWWMINPEAKGIKSSRRRTASMDPTGDLLKKRAKAKSRVEELRRASGLNPALYRSESESNFPNAVGGDANQLVDPFTYGQQEFRMRSGSSASSYGRLSPLQPFLDASPSTGGWGSQQGLAGDAGLIMGNTSSDNLADLWETALTLTAADVDPLFGANASEQLSLNLFGGADAFLRAPPAYDDSSISSDVQPQVLLQHASGDSLQSLNSSALGLGVSGSSPLNAGLQQNQQQNAFTGIQLQPGSNTMLTQQELETQSLINELLADGIKNDAAMRYQYGTTGIDMGSTADMQPPQQVQQQPLVQQSQQQFLAFPDQVLGDFKPLLMNGNVALAGSITTTSPIISSGGELYVLNTVNGGALKVDGSPTLVSASYPSLISSPYGTQPNLATSQGIQLAPANGVQNNVILDLSGILQQQFVQPLKVQQQNVAGLPVANVKTEDVLLSLLQRQKQQNLMGGGLQLGMGEIDVSLQELRASGLSCDMEQILRDGNLDLIVD